MILPRALRFPMFAMARPLRPQVERMAVLDAAAIVRGETGVTASDPVAAIIAARVVAEMQAYLMEEMDPFLAALGDARRKSCPCPFALLATDPKSDAISLFTQQRIERLRSRSGRGLSLIDDKTECCEVWDFVQRRLHSRFMREIRRGWQAPPM